MPGAGKSTVAEAIRDEGFTLINMGDCIRMEAKKNNLELNDKNLGSLMLNLRKKFGPGAVAQLVINQINEKYYTPNGNNKYLMRKFLLKLFFRKQSFQYKIGNGTKTTILHR